MDSRAIAICVRELRGAHKDCHEAVELIAEWHKAIVGLRGN